MALKSKVHVAQNWLNLERVKKSKLVDGSGEQDYQIRCKKTYTDRSPMVTGQSTEEAKGWKSRKMKTSEGHRKAANPWLLMMC